MKNFKVHSNFTEEPPFTHIIIYLDGITLISNAQRG